MGLKLMAEIGLDGSGFERGLHRMGQAAAESVKTLAVQAFGIYGIEEAIRKTVETASDLVDQSQRLDVTVEQLQLLRQAAKDAGSDMGALAGAFEKLDIARAKALGGDKDALAAFAKLGVSQLQLKNQTASQLFTGTISNTVKNSNAEDIGPVLKEVFGKGFGELIPVLKTDFDELGGKMKALGSIMDTDTAVKLDALGDNFSLLSNIMTSELAPVLVTLSEALLALVGHLHATGAGLEQLLNGNGGGPKNWWQGAASLQKVLVDGVINKIPGKLGDTLQDASDSFHQAIYGVSPKDALNNVMGAAEAFTSDDDEQQKRIDDLKKQLADLAEQMKHPKPRATGLPDATAPAEKKLAAMQADALVRVGNFLGINGTTISRVDQQKLDLMRQQVSELKGIRDKIGGGGNFGGIIPVV